MSDGGNSNSNSNSSNNSSDNGWTTVTRKQPVPKPQQQQQQQQYQRPTKPSMFSPLRYVGQQIQGQQKVYSGNNKNSSGPNLAAVERQIDDGTFQLPTVSHDLKVQIQKARAAKGWTQNQLAKACNLLPAIVRDYENGTANPIPDEISRMGKALGVVLKNPKKAVTTE